MKRIYNRSKRLLSSVGLVALGFLLPVLTFAQQGNIIPCDGVDIPCDFTMIMKLLSNILDFLIMISIPLAAIAFAFAGFTMITAAGNSGKIEKAKSIFVKVGIGFIVVLSAWLIVRLITNALLDENKYYDFLDNNGSSVMRYMPGVDELG